MPNTCVLDQSGVHSLCRVWSRSFPWPWSLQVTEAGRRQRASRISKHVTLYWAKIDKLTIYKHRSQLDAKRREAMDRHLTFLVNQTERYSARLTVPLAQQQVWGLPD